MAIVGLLKLNVQVLRDGSPAIGPGKAMVLEAIQATGSISAAGRKLGMSYRRAWLLVESLNADWVKQVVATSPGGGAGSGSHLTGFGIELLATYRAMEAAMITAADGADLDWLTKSTRALPNGTPSSASAERNKTRSASERQDKERV